MHLETIAYLRALAATHDATVPVSKALLLDLLDSYREAGTPACPPLVQVILQQLLNADDYDAIKAVKAAAQDYLHSLNPCPLDVPHPAHDYCNGTPSSSRQSSPIHDLVAALKRDAEYAWGWHCNLAMSMHDAGAGPHAACNRGAALFLSHLTDGQVDTTQHPAYQPTQDSNLYLIISEERRTYGLVWFYAPNSQGYTACTVRAGRYTEAEAAAILRGTAGELTALRESDLPKLQILHHIDLGYGDNGATLKALTLSRTALFTPPAASPTAPPHPPASAADTPRSSAPENAPPTP